MNIKKVSITEVVARWPLAIVVIGSAVAIIVVPTEWLPKCPIHQVTGLLCPGCGGQRAVAALFRGDIASALKFNTLMFTIPLFVGLGWLAERKKSKSLRLLTIGFAAAATLIFTVLRNI